MTMQALELQKIKIVLSHYFILLPTASQFFIFMQYVSHGAVRSGCLNLSMLDCLGRTAPAFDTLCLV